jgi:hypothetical protein
MFATLAACCAIAAAGGPSGDDAYAFARSLTLAGARPAASASERRAQARVAKRFRAAGLQVETDTFRVPGKGRSRNVVGVLDTPATCLRVVMAHIDTVPPSPGANDNASGVGALVAIADVIAASGASCDVWLIATGAEERIYTGHPDHLGASTVVRRIKRKGRRGDLQYGLSIDEVGNGSSFWVKSKSNGARIERPLVASGKSAGVSVKWVRDGAGGGNSDHRELQRAGLVAAKIGVPSYPVRHTAADKLGRIQKSSFSKALAVIWPVVSR